MPRSTRRALAALVTLLAIGCQTAAPTTSPTQVPTAPPTPTATIAPTPIPSVVEISDVLRLTIWRAMSDTLDSGTARVRLTAVLDGVPTMPDGVAFEMSGSTSFGYPAEMAFGGDFSGFKLGQVDFIAQGDLLYMKGDFLEALGVPSGKWLVVDKTSDDPRAAAFEDVAGGQNDASIALYYLFGLQLPIERLTPNQRFGISTAAFAGDVRLTGAIRYLTNDDHGAVILENILALDQQIHGDVTAEVWIADSMIRELTYEFGLGYTDAGGVLRVTYAFDGFGEPLDLGIPARKDIVALKDIPA